LELHRPPTRDGTPSSPPGAVTELRDRLRVARFFAGLAVKEHLAPGLHLKPLVAELFLTDNCNLRCVTCACWRTTTRGELTTAEWCAAIDQLPGVGILKVNFTGGEPLLRADAPTLVARARDAGIRSLHLNTNAVLLDDRRRAAVLDAGVRSFNVSLDGPDPATHDAVRGVVGSFERSTEHLRALLERRDADRLRVRVNFTVTRSNATTLPQMIRFARRHRVPLSLNLTSDTTFLFRDAEVTQQRRVPDAVVDEVLAEVEALLREDRRGLPRPSDWAFLRRYFREGTQRKPPCAESQLKLLIRSTGDVGGCWVHEGTADVRARPLADIVASPRYRRDHARFFVKDCAGCTSGYGLNLARRPMTHVRDAAWRRGRWRISDG
jgi:MoaA/NifB/PqqE/SkfB family radical SAM enzyme